MRWLVPLVLSLALVSSAAAEPEPAPPAGMIDRVEAELSARLSDLEVRGVVVVSTVGAVCPPDVTCITWRVHARGIHVVAEITLEGRSRPMTVRMASFGAVDRSLDILFRRLRRTAARRHHREHPNPSP